MTKLIKIIGRIFLIACIGFLLYFFSVAEEIEADGGAAFNRFTYEEISKITVGDVCIKIKSIFMSTKDNIPEIATSMAYFAVSGDEFGQPIDEKPSKEITPVFSVQGGTVTETGFSNGYYIVISHAKGAKSVYENCSSIYVQRLERVRKGQIIGEYDTNSNAEFSYSLVTSEPNSE